MPDSPALKKTVRILKGIQYTLHVHIYCLWWKDILHVHTAGGGQEYTLHVRTRLLVVLNLLTEKKLLIHRYGTLKCMYFRLTSKFIIIIIKHT
jgi:hypothetical protein